MNIEIPKIGMTFSRILMPQIGDLNDYLKKLKENDIHYKEEKVDPKSLKATQSEFNTEKIAQIMIEPNMSSKGGVIVSNDDYVLDGHHRWIACYNKNTSLKIIRVDLPILELMRISKTFDTIGHKSVVESVKSVIREHIGIRELLNTKRTDKWNL